jgi:hypothetical protein
MIIPTIILFIESICQFFIFILFIVLLVKGSRSCYYPSIYLDSSGEVNEYRGQNRLGSLF